MFYLPQEGIIHDDMIIAPPTATKRHKRALHNETHTIWKKAMEVFNFEDDELFGNYIPCTICIIMHTPGAVVDQPTVF